MQVERRIEAIIFFDTDIPEALLKENNSDKIQAHCIGLLQRAGVAFKKDPKSLMDIVGWYQIETTANKIRVQWECGERIPGVE